MVTLSTVPAFISAVVATNELNVDVPVKVDVPTTVNPVADTSVNAPRPEVS